MVLRAYQITVGYSSQLFPRVTLCVIDYFDCKKYANSFSFQLIHKIQKFVFDSIQIIILSRFCTARLETPQHKSC